MNEREPNSHDRRDARVGVPLLTRYREPSFARSMLELVITAVPFVFLWMLTLAGLDAGYWLCLLLEIGRASCRERV